MIVKMPTFAAVLFTLIQALSPATQAMQPEATDSFFTSHSVSLNGYSIPYAVYLSPSLGSAQNQPIILAFHGSGEAGNDGLKQTTVGIGPALRAHPERYASIVVLPQMPAGHVWHDKMNAADANSPTCEDLALLALEETIETFSADRTHVYVTGNSLGGFATWELAATHTDLFAAAMPIAGGGDPATMAPLLKNMPVWAAHGWLDQDVKFSYSDEMVNAVRAQGNTDVHFSVYHFSFHNVWDKTYGDEKSTNWLFSHALKTTPPESAAARLSVQALPKPAPELLTTDPSISNSL